MQLFNKHKKPGPLIDGAVRVLKGRLPILTIPERYDQNRPAGGFLKSAFLRVQFHFKRNVTLIVLSLLPFGNGN